MKIILLVLIGMLLAGSSASAAVYTDNGDGTVTDVVTNRMWQKEDDGAARTWEAALSYCESLTLGGYSDWRLPNIKELVSLVDTSRNRPAVNSVYFPNSQPSNYWSSTSYAGDTSGAWLVNVYFGDTNNDGKLNAFFVRCVR